MLINNKCKTYEVPPLKKIKIKIVTCATTKHQAVETAGQRETERTCSWILTPRQRGVWGDGVGGGGGGGGGGERELEHFILQGLFLKLICVVGSFYMALSSRLTAHAGSVKTEQRDGKKRKREGGGGGEKERDRK